MKRCPICGVSVKDQNYERHMAKVHGGVGPSATGAGTAPAAGATMGPATKAAIAVLAVVAVLLAGFAIHTHRSADGEDGGDEGAEGSGGDVGSGGNGGSGEEGLAIEEDGTRNAYVDMTTTMGRMRIEVFTTRPAIQRTTANFMKLVRDGFYDGLIFHRVIDDFMIQCGGYEPGMVKRESPYGPIPLEIDPGLKHLDGYLGMARTSDPNSATSQFYICDGAPSHLDGSYAVFGRVVSGMEVVRKIASVPTDSNDAPLEDVVIQRMIVVA